MDDGVLSQEEINALLNAGDSDDDLPDEEVEESSGEEATDHLTTIEIDTIGEIGNISFGTSATTLSTLLNQKVDITTPEISVIKKADLEQAFSFDHVRVQVNYEDGFTGVNMFVIKSEDAAIISDIMLGGDGSNPETDLNEIHLSAVQEVMNQMIGSAATSMSTIFNKPVNISPPTIELVKEEDSNTTEEIEDIENETMFVKASFQLKVGELIDSNIMQLIPFPFAHELVEQLLNSSEPDLAEEVPTKAEVVTEDAKPQAPIQEKSEPQFMGNPVDASKAQVQTASFSNFEPVQLEQNEQRNLDMLLDIPLNVTVELGRTKRPIRDILDLSPGSIVELDKLAGEPVDVLVNEKLIAKGEVVVIDENFGVRITDIISKSERIMKLN